ncbi:MAG: hypothetical protein AAF447_19800 [Myxococcota bacterium]
MSIAIALVLATLALSAAPAAAQDPVASTQQIDASPKGTIGLGLIGAELGFMFPALLGRAVPAFHDTWAFIVFPTAFAAGGAVAGWFALDSPNRSEAAVGVLAGSFALLVPTLVITLVSTAYDPDRDIIEASDAPPAADPADEETPAEARRMPSEPVDPRVVALRAGTGLLRVQGGRLHLGMPGVSVVPRYTPQQIALYGGQQDHEVRLSLFSGAF